MATPRAGGAPPVTGDRYLDLFVRFVASRAGELLDGSLTLRLHPVGLHYVASRLEALRELEAVGAGAPVDYLRAYVADLGDHRALEQLRRILRLLTSLKVVAAGPGRDPSPLFLLPFARLRVLELRGCDLRVEINEAWRIRPAVDHTVLPKGKSQAKYEAVTLPENVMDMEVEQPMLFTDTDTAKFRGMRLEDLDEQYVNVNLDDDDLSRAEHHHQAEAVNITLVDNFESGLAETDVFNRFERFDIADDDTTVNITPDQHPQAPSTLISSPPRQEDPPQQQEQYQAAPSPNREEPQQVAPCIGIYS